MIKNFGWRPSINRKPFSVKTASYSKPIRRIIKDDALVEITMEEKEKDIRDP
jgi:hypothetical protein